DVSVKSDELENKNKELLKQLHTDSLTGLANRIALREDLEKCNNPIVTIFDIDEFKGINDLYGIDVGNTVLIKIANIISELSGEHIKVYRTGSDEFITLQDEKVFMHEYEKKIKNIIAQINAQSLFLKKHDISVYVDVTVGIAHDYKNCLEKADIALRQAQESHLSFLMYCDDFNLDSKYENDIKWTEIIREAVSSKNIVPYFQPIVDKDENIIKYESLMRLIHKGEVISPFYFLDISKKAKFYSIMMKMMIEQTFKIIKETKKDITVNLSIQDIHNQQMVDYIKSELITLDIAKHVIFEITESESIHSYDKIYEFIIDVKKLGCRIAIDDFGSGYSNFSYILKLQPDYLKIDGSLIKDIHVNKHSYIITKTISEFAHRLGISTIAEYVHNEEVFEILKKLDIDSYQGFYFSEAKENL
ncbi:MAG: EAL domain-containing protein, partial [Campylobacteraceae bacterium]|nr:EAL domain-containing protein [Campylobacteraceae bacterium]